MTSEALRQSVSVRMEGGLGDHVLGMRVLRFAHDRYPGHDIVVYSDAGGHGTPLEVVRLSPLVSDVVPVHQVEPPPTVASMGLMTNLRPDDRNRIMSGTHAIDGSGGSFFAAASIAFDVPLFDILGERPALITPASAKLDAIRYLAHPERTVFVATNLSKYGDSIRGCFHSRIVPFLRALLAHDHVVLLNLFTSCYDYPHWPPPERARRSAHSIQDALLHLELSRLSDRVVSCVDLPIATVVALLERCRYFVGVDNGIKHLAWALGVPHTFFYPEAPPLPYVIRWMPDIHRMLLFDCSESALDAHIRAANAAIVGNGQAVRSALNSSVGLVQP